MASILESKKLLKNRPINESGGHCYVLCDKRAILYIRQNFANISKYVTNIDKNHQCLKQQYNYILTLNILVILDYELQEKIFDIKANSSAILPLWLLF